MPTVDQHAYLECYDPARNHDKFYQAARRGKVVCLQWGRCGTKGQSKVETFSTEISAQRAFDEKIDDKRRKGYRVAHGAMEFPAGFADTAPVSDPDTDTDPADYFLQWKAERPIAQADLETAAELVNRIISRTQHLLSPRFILQEGEDWRQVYFLADGEQVAAFGYPPVAFLESLTSRERKAVMEMGTSRDGWLSNNGTGQGIITTGKQLFDFPVRLFLSILAHNNGLAVSCSENLEYGATGLRVSRDLEGFDWYPLWHELAPIVDEHWFVVGSTRVFVTAPIEEGERQYAW